MIVVLGRPSLPAGWRSEPGPDEPARSDLEGRAAQIALAARAAGADVELVGSVGDDPEGDEVMVRLGRAGVGHAAVLRDPSARTPVGREAASLPRLDATDISLGLSYVADCRVLVLAEPLPPDAQSVAAEAAAYHGAAVIAIVEAGSDAPAGLPADATLLEAPHPETGEDDGPADEQAETDSAERSYAFNQLVGQYAAALHRGDDPAKAFRTASHAAGWEPVSD